MPVQIFDPDVDLHVVTIAFLHLNTVGDLREPIARICAGLLSHRIVRHSDHTIFAVDGIGRCQRVPSITCSLT